MCAYVRVCVCVCVWLYFPDGLLFSLSLEESKYQSSFLERPGQPIRGRKTTEQTPGRTNPINTINCMSFYIRLTPQGWTVVQIGYSVSHLHQNSPKWRTRAGNTSSIQNLRGNVKDSRLMSIYTSTTGWTGSWWPCDSHWCDVVAWRRIHSVCTAQVVLNALMDR